MKKQLVVLILLIIIFNFFVGCQEESSNNQDTIEYSTYENSELGFSIEYPSDWNKLENPQEVPDVTVVFASPSNEPTKTGNLMVSILDNILMTMEEFKDAHIENLSSIISNFTLISEKSITISDLPGYEIIYTFTEGMYTWRQLEVWTIANDILYFLVHQADQAYYENFANEIDHMINSFSITDTGL